MNTNVYNIVWADDDIDALFNNYEKRFKKNGLSIIKCAHDAKELEDQISELGNRIDAVIVDANFNYSKEPIESERDVRGLDYAHSLYSFTLKRSIPFFLFTQRSDELLRDKLSNKPEFLQDFPRHKRWFKKNDDDEFYEMIEQIKKEVDNRNTDAFRIRNKYAKEFEAAKNIDDAVRYLENGLLFSYENDSWKNVQDYFNPARKIVERIISSCKSMKILPPNVSLNVASKLFSGLDCGYTLKEQLMEKPLAESLFYFLKITQDGSHDANDLQLNVDQYVRETKNINLYRTTLYIAMDLLLWHERMREKFSNNSVILWNSNYIYEGKVCKHPSGKFFYCGKYQIETKDINIKDGDWIGILKSEPNKYPKGNITEYVRKNNFFIINNAENTSGNEGNKNNKNVENNLSVK